MTTGENTVQDRPACSVDGCTNDVVMTDPLPLCAMDALRIAAGHKRAVDPGGPISRVMALALIHASPLATNAELAERTGWPKEWVASHRRLDRG